MDQATFELSYRVEHRHGDGSWGEMLEDRSRDHDSAAHDPERNWGIRRIFRCTSCDEAVTLIPGENGGAEPEE
jgi:hypothetical protein